jgi:hypothetical protein
MGAVYSCFLNSLGFRKGPLLFETGRFYLLHVDIDGFGCVCLLSSWSIAPVRNL